MKKFLIKMFKGAAIGFAMIIPGVSGGSVAVLLNIYDEIIFCINDLRHNFIKSIKELIPIIVGMILAFVAMYFPIKLLLNYYPLQITSFFAGLIIGSIPKLCSDTVKNGFDKKYDIIAFLISFIFIVGICFIPNMNDVNLISMNVLDYLLLLLIGVIASCALIVPGISGSMMLLIFGYYQPILNIISDLKNNPIHSIVVLLVFIIGIIIGFFTIAKFMKFLLSKYKRITYWSILGFVIGSILALFISFDYLSASIDLITILSSLLFLIVGVILSFIFSRLIKDGE